jgi:hypothetical protein
MAKQYIKIMFLFGLLASLDAGDIPVSPNHPIIVEDFEENYQYEWQAICGTMTEERWDVGEGSLHINNPEDVLRYIYLKSLFWSEFVVEVDVKLLASYRDGRVGIVFGKKNHCLFLFRICFDSQTVDFRYLTNEPFTWYDLHSAKIMKKLTLNNWYRLKLVAKNGLLRFSVDEEVVLEIKNRLDHDLISGAIGLYCVEGYAYFDNFYAKSLDTIPIGHRYGVEQLAQDLANLSWRYKYERNVFDCTNQSAALATYLKSLGWNVWIAANENHSWVRVETNPGYYTDVEATTLKINWDRPKALAEYEVEDLIRTNPEEYGFPEDCLIVYPK